MRQMVAAAAREGPKRVVRQNTASRAACDAPRMRKGADSVSEKPPEPRRRPQCLARNIGAVGLPRDSPAGSGGSRITACGSTVSRKFRFPCRSSTLQHRDAQVRVHRMPPSARSSFLIFGRCAQIRRCGKLTQAASAFEKTGSWLKGRMRQIAAGHLVPLAAIIRSNRMLWDTLG